MTTKTISSLILAGVLMSSALAGVQVAPSQTQAPFLSADAAVVLIVPARPHLVPAAGGLKVAPSPVVRIAP